MKSFRLDARSAFMPTATQIADWIVRFRHDDLAVPVDPMSLEKLVYYAQCFRLALAGVRLFSDEIYARRHGPVIPAVYDAYEAHGAQPIIPTPGDAPQLGTDIEQFLSEVVRFFRPVHRPAIIVRDPRRGSLDYGAPGIWQARQFPRLDARRATSILLLLVDCGRGRGSFPARASRRCFSTQMGSPVCGRHIFPSYFLASFLQPGINQGTCSACARKHANVERVLRSDRRSGIG
jgi:Protein of unknown function (DUF4065)